MSNAKIFITEREKDILLFFTGHIMAVHSQALFDYLKQLLTDRKIEKIWVDFNNCIYIDSTTIGTLILLDNQLKKMGGELILCNLTLETEEVIKKMGLFCFFNIIQVEAFKQLSKFILKQIPVEKDKKISLEFVLDAHKCIVKLSPEMNEEFKSLLETLEKNKESDGARH